MHTPPNAELDRRINAAISRQLAPSPASLTLTDAALLAHCAIDAANNANVPLFLAWWIPTACSATSLVRITPCSSAIRWPRKKHGPPWRSGCRPTDSRPTYCLAPACTACRIRKVFAALAVGCPAGRPACCSAVSASAAGASRKISRLPRRLWRASAASDFCSHHSMNLSKNGYRQGSSCRQHHWFWLLTVVHLLSSSPSSRAIRRPRCSPGWPKSWGYTRPALPSTMRKGRRPAGCLTVPAIPARWRRCSPGSQSRGCCRRSAPSVIGWRTAGMISNIRCGSRVGHRAYP